MECDIQPLGKPEEIRLVLNNDLCEISWNQATMEIFTHATKPVGWCRIKTSAKDIRPLL